MSGEPISDADLAASVKRASDLANEVTDLVIALRAAREEVERLERWKAEATTVLERWEDVWDALGKPGVLGCSKATASVAEVERLRAEAEDAYARCTADVVAFAAEEDDGLHLEGNDEHATAVRNFGKAIEAGEHVGAATEGATPAAEGVEPL